MSVSLRTRLANAACAFQTGHSVRDLDRIDRRRLGLLGRRLVRQLDRLADSFDDPEDSLGLRASHRASARAVEDLTARAVEGRERVAKTALLKELSFRRSLSYMRRREEVRDFEVAQDLGDASASKLEPVPVAPAELYGKFHEGLLEDRGLYFRFYQHRLTAWDWHVCLRLVWSAALIGLYRLSGRGPP